MRHLCNGQIFENLFAVSVLAAGLSVLQSVVRELE